MTPQERAELMQRVERINVGDIPAMPHGVQERIENSLAARCQDEVKALRAKKLRTLVGDTQIVLA